jgi:hypothetical protein
MTPVQKSRRTSTAAMPPSPQVRVKWSVRSSTVRGLKCSRRLFKIFFELLLSLPGRERLGNMEVIIRCIGDYLR